MAEMTSDQFLVIRGMLALAHVDGKLSTDEASLVKSRIETLGVSQEQAAVLRADIQTPADPMGIYQDLEGDKSKGWFLSCARVLFHADGEFCADEKAVMAKLEAAHSESMKTTVVVLEQDLTRIKDRVDRDVEGIKEHAKKNLGPLSYLMAWFVEQFE